MEFAVRNLSCMSQLSTSWRLRLLCRKQEAKHDAAGRRLCMLEREIEASADLSLSLGYLLLPPEAVPSLDHSPVNTMLTQQVSISPAGR